MESVSSTLHHPPHFIFSSNIIIEFDDAGVVQEIDAVNINSGDVKPGALAQIGKQLLLVFRSDHLYFFIDDHLEALLGALPYFFEDENHQDDRNVGNHDFHESSFKRAERVDDGDGDDRKQISHFFNRHGDGAVAQNAEQGEQSETESEGKFQRIHEMTDEKNQQIEHEEGKQVVLVLHARIIDERDNGENGGEIEREFQQ